MIIRDNFLKLIADGLRKNSVHDCATWASEYRIMGEPFPGPVRYDVHPWTKEMRNCNVDWCGPKAAQMGYTEVCLDKTFYTLDQKKRSVLYLLPKSKPDAADFSRARFDKALELSDYIKQMFSKTNNVGLKQTIAGANLYVRGTQSKSGVKSVDVALIVFDEFDEMNMRNVPQAEERLSGQEHKQKIKISTPTVPDYGIDKSFKLSTQDHFFFRCPSCGKYTELIFPDCLVITADDLSDSKNIRRSYIRCNECANPLDHTTKRFWLKDGIWRPTGDPEAPERGFYINQLYSSTVAPWEIAEKALKAQFDPSEEQEYWNSKGGLPHVPEGSRVTEEALNSCLSDFNLGKLPTSPSLVTMGVDQGKWIYYEVNQWFIPGHLGPDLNLSAHPKVLMAGKVSAFEELDILMKKFQVRTCVIDANPERRKAYEFATRFYGHVYMCFYNRGLSGKQIDVKKELLSVGVDRTSWLDLAIGRFHRGKERGIELPANIPTEYREHQKNLIRLLKKDNDGNPIAKYINVGDDHYGHARNYAEIALPLAISVLQNKDVGAFL